MRFSEDCPSAPTLPTRIVIVASTATAGPQLLCAPISATSKKRRKRAERGGLRRHRHERRDRRRRALVHVRRPLVKRRHRGLEAQADDAQRDARQRQRVGRQAAAARQRAARSRRSRSRRSRRRSSPGRTAASPSRPRRRSGTSAPTPASARGAARVAHSTYSGIDSSSRPTNSATVFCAAASSDMPAIERQQQRVELAVRGFARGQRAPRQQHAERAAGRRGSG